MGKASKDRGKKVPVPIREDSRLCVHVPVGKGGKITFQVREGYNSFIHIIEIGGIEKVYKVIGAKKGAFSYCEAKTLAYALIRYHRLLKATGLKIPALEKIVLLVDRTKLVDKKTELVIVSPYVGEDAEVLLRETEDKDRIASLVTEMMESLKSLLEYRHVAASPIGMGLRTSSFKCVLDDSKICQHQVTVGIDSKPANFCKSNGTMYLVDFFPPRFRQVDKVLVEVPFPKTQIGYKLGYWKHFTACGILHVFLSQLCRIKPALREDFEELILGTLSRFSGIEDCVGNYFRDSCWRAVRIALKAHDPMSVIRIVTEMGPADIYRMREIAAELAFAEVMTAEAFEAFYKASHFEDELPIELVSTLRDLLIKSLSSLK